MNIERRNGALEVETRKSSRLMIIDENGRLLLFLYKDEHQAPFWATVGGELKPSESYVEAAKRELYEETGLIQDVDEMLRERDDVYAVARSVPARWLEKYFLVKWPATERYLLQSGLMRKRVRFKRGNGGAWTSYSKTKPLYSNLIGFLICFALYWRENTYQTILNSAFGSVDHQ